MKKYIIGLCLLLTLMGGVSYAAVEWGGRTYDNCDASPDPSQCKDDTGGRNFVEGITVDVADALREVEEFNLRMQYYLRPYEEKDLSFNQWMDLYGYGTSGRGVIPGGEFNLPDARMFGGVGASTDLRAYILNILQWVLSFLGIIAIAVVIFAGYIYIVGGEENNEKAKKMIMYASIGIIVILSSYAVVNTLITKTMEGGDNFEAVQNYISTDDIMTGGVLEAVCITPEGDDCAQSMGAGGWAVEPYNEVSFSLSGVAEQQNVKWNFGDGGLYPGEEDGGGITRSFSDSNKWYNVAVMGEYQDDEIKKFVGQARVWVGDVAEASFKVSQPGILKSGQQVKFDATGSSVVAGSLDKYIWSCEGGACGDFDSNAMATATHGKKQFFHTFEEEGVVTVSLTIVAKFGAAGEISSKPFNMDISVGGVMGDGGSTGVDIDFDVPASPMRGEESSLVAIGDMDYDYEWEFPADDFTTSGTIVNHSFGESGAQEVILSAFDDGEREVGAVSKIFVVGDRNMPVAVAKVNGEFVLPGRDVEIVKGGVLDIVSDSCDESQRCGGEAELSTSWGWNGNPVLPAHLEEIPTISGVHNLVMSIVSLNDGTKSASQNIKVMVLEDDPGIELTVTPETSLGAGFYRLKAKASPGGNEIARYRFEVIEFGKVVDVQMLQSKQVEVQTIVDLSRFVGTHNYTFKVEVIDTAGGKSVKSIEQLVVVSEEDSNNVPPVVEIFTTPSTSGDTSTTFRFFTQSSDDDGDNLTYVWRLPDGKSVIGKSVVHRFTKPGNYLVKVEVSDGLETVTDTESIEVLDSGVTPPGQNSTPIVRISGVNPGDAGDTSTRFSFFSNASDPDQDDLVYEWNFGDGKVSSLKNVTHAYGRAGTFKVVLKVSDGVASAEANMTVRVVNEGEVIPESSLAPYEQEYHSAGLNPENVAIVSGKKDLEAFAGEMQKFYDDKLLLLAGCDNQVDDCEKLEKEMGLLDMVRAKTEALALESDPEVQKKLNDEINSLLAQLRSLDEAFTYDFATIQGSVNTTFFLYGQINFETDRPLWMEWDTGDGRTFSGQDVAWKYSEEGLYDVTMTVSDGTASVTNSLTINVE